MYAEIIYEDGSFSVASVDNQDDLVASLKEHHERAKVGAPIHGSFAPHERPIPATRIVRVLLYDQHPADIPEVVSADVAKSLATEAVKTVAADTSPDSGGKGLVDLYALGHELLPKALLTDTGPHESNYVMESVDELDPALWGGE